MNQFIRGSTSATCHRPSGAVNPVRPPKSPHHLSSQSFTLSAACSTFAILTFSFIRHQVPRGRHGLPLSGRCLHYRSHRGGIVYVATVPRCDLAANERVWILDMLFHGEGEAFNVRDLPLHPNTSTVY
jgi:hypothetical protein